MDNKWDEVLALARSEDLETVVSNTTEAGIAYNQGDSAFDQVPPNSFPAKLTRVLYERYKAFNGAADKGLAILSCELIDNNGKGAEEVLQQLRQGLGSGSRIHRLDEHRKHLLLHAGGPHRSGPHP